MNPPPGMSAQWPGQCPRCDQPIHRGDRIYFRRGQAVHCACQSGGDDD